MSGNDRADFGGGPHPTGSFESVSEADVSQSLNDALNAQRAQRKKMFTTAWERVLEELLPPLVSLMTEGIAALSRHAMTKRKRR